MMDQKNQATQGGGPRQRPARVLIIDDNPTFVLSLKTFLEDRGYQGLSATSTEEGLQMIQSLKPDLILLDIMMETPHSGFHICSTVKNDPRSSHIPIIGISGMEERLGVRYCPETDREFFNPDAYFEKPIDFDDLLNEIQTLIKTP